MKISDKAAGISPSLTLEITAKANEMRKNGISVIGFGAGEPDFRTPDYIVEAGKRALDLGLTKYTPVAGMPELKREVCAKFKRDNGLDYTPDQIVVSCGAKSSLFHALSAIIDVGDEVIIPVPYWLTYPEIVRMCGGKPIFAPTYKEDGYKLTAKTLSSLINDKTKCLILNSPSNPSGVVYSRSELEAIGKVVEQSGIYVVSDEIYEKLIFDGEKHISIASLSDKLKEQTIVVNGVSKTYAMTGWRIGYLACDKKLCKAITAFQSHSTSNATSVSQYAAAVALEGGEQFIENMAKTFDERRLYAVSRIAEIKGLSLIQPKGAFYIFIDISALIGKKFKGQVIDGSVKFASLLLDCGVAVVPGKPFGMDDHVRISYAVSKEDIAVGFDRIAKFVSELD